jgi:anti-sigma B factor antagonist
MPDTQAHPDPITARANRLPPAFACSWTGDGADAAWVRVAGELDLATTPQLVRTLRACQLRARLVALDLRGLEFMDSSGVHAIVNASVRARRLGGRLILLRASRDVDRMFRLTGSSDQVEIGELGTGQGLPQALLQVAEKAFAS